MMSYLAEFPTTAYYSYDWDKSHTDELYYIDEDYVCVCVCLPYVCILQK